MPSLPTLFTVSILATTALVCAAPAADKAMARKVQNINDQAIRSALAEKKRRRAKRAVLIEEVPVEDDIATEDEIDRQLSALSDAQLEMLAEVVQNELENYSPRQQVEEYEIVQIPKEVLVPQILEQFDDSDDEPQMEELYPRDRRSQMPLVDLDDADLEEMDNAPEVVVVPEDVLEQALLENERDEMELRMRISEIAQLLNERAARGL